MRRRLARVIEYLEKQGWQADSKTILALTGILENEHDISAIADLFEAFRQ